MSINVNMIMKSGKKSVAETIMYNALDRINDKVDGEPMDVLEKALENVYRSVQNDNEDIDASIKDLKLAMVTEGKKSVEIDPTRLAYNNRQGKKLMQSYFKKRGVKIEFAKS